MNAGFLAQLYQQAIENPNAVALEQLSEDGQSRVVADYQTLLSTVASFVICLKDLNVGDGHRVGIAASNSPEWLWIDLALQLCGAVSIPVPLTFSDEQVENLLGRADLILVDDPGAERIQKWTSLNEKIRWQNVSSWIEQTHLTQDHIADVWTQGMLLSDARLLKIIHTSGTTGAPKGVMISCKALDIQSNSMGEGIKEDLGHIRYLSLLPLSLLIEQLFAINTILITGGTLVLLPESVMPLGAGRVPAKAYIEYIRAAKPSLIVVPPAIVEVLLAIKKQRGFSEKSDWQTFLGSPERSMLCCGGAPVSSATVRSLSDSGLPVYGGYGLSEACSVVSWNQPSANRIGTVGRASSHTQIKLAEDDELLVKSPALFTGYAGSDATALVSRDGWLQTGDIAKIDDDGYVSILGRKRNMIITSTGRNVSPEWVEVLLTEHSKVNYASVFGDGLESLVVVIVANSDSSSNDIADWLTEVNKQLPDFAQIQRWISTSESEFGNFLTVTQRVNRTAMWSHYSKELDSAHQIKEDVAA